MPPVSKRLPRRRNARSGELNLEEVCEERIDAVTAEPLVAGKYVEVLSPDKTLKLFYNTSTLVRIAIDKGMFMQPPHFREPMELSMQRTIEELEGKTFHFEARDEFVPADDGPGGRAVHHRHVYFDQIVEEFYLLNPAELYVCSVCYEHYVQTRFIPDEERNGHRVSYLEQDGEENAMPVLDPLDVLTHMAQPDAVHLVVDGDGDDAASHASQLPADCALLHVAFRFAAPWKKHMKLHHGVVGVSAEDYTVRARLCNFYSHFNQMQTERYEARLATHGTAKPQHALTQQRYWLYNAGYNRLRYNRLVEAVTDCDGDARTYEVSAFPGEAIAVEANPVEDDGESDFICDDSESASDAYFPHYSPSDDEDNDDDAAAAAGRKKRRTVAGRKRRRPGDTQSDTSASSSSPSSSASTVDSTSGDDDEEDDDEEDEEEFVSSQIQKQHHLFKRGLLAERDCYYERLSAEDRQFLDKESRRANAVRSTLYDPKLSTLTTGAGGRVVPQAAPPTDVNDWDNIGEALQSPHSLLTTSKVPAAPTRSAATPPKTFRTSAMLLDDDEE